MDERDLTLRAQPVGVEPVGVVGAPPLAACPDNLVVQLDVRDRAVRELGEVRPPPVESERDDGAVAGRIDDGPLEVTGVRRDEPPLARNLAVADKPLAVDEKRRAGHERDRPAQTALVVLATGRADLADIRDPGDRRRRVHAPEERPDLRRVVAWADVITGIDLERGLVAVWVAAAEDGVDDTREGLPILGVERPRDHLDLLEHTPVERERGRVVVRVVDRDALDLVLHLPSPPASEVPVDDAGLEVDDVVQFLDRQRGDLVAADRGDRARLRYIDERLFGRDDDLLARNRLVLQGDVQFGRRVR